MASSYLRQEPVDGGLPKFEELGNLDESDPAYGGHFHRRKPWALCVKLDSLHSDVVWTIPVQEVASSGLAMRNCLPRPVVAETPRRPAL